MKRGLLTVQDIKNFIFEAISINGSTLVVSGRKLCEILAIDNRRLRTYVKEGLPYIAKGKMKLYNVLDVKRWLVSRSEMGYYDKRMEERANELP